MGEHYGEIAAVLGRVRARWRLHEALGAWSQGAALAAFALALALPVNAALAPVGWSFVALWAVAVTVAVTCMALSLLRVRHTPSDATIARLIEERCPELDDTLAAAVSPEARAGRTPVAEAVVADAARRARGLDVRQVIPSQWLRRRSARAAGATIALAVAGVLVAGPLVRAGRTFAVMAFPERVLIDVTPGDVRLRAGQSLQIDARLSGGAVAVAPVLHAQQGGSWYDATMTAGEGAFTASFDNVQQGFRYAVSAGGARSREYTVTVVHPPRVERIDLRYEFPPALHMEPRLEEDGGDIYAPAGTRVRLLVHTNKPVVQGNAAIAGAGAVALTARGNTLEGQLTVSRDGSYRIALSDADGLENAGDTEYFIRTLQDRPPDVRIVRPGGDRQVTPLEEVTIAARADDDFGIGGFDLVYSVRGSGEKVIPFRRDGTGMTVDGEQTLYLEDLGVSPGDFVTYYARARDVARGKRSSEARSDIFFLEVKPFEEEFVAAQSQGGGSGSGDRSMDDLVQAQKDVITATWRLDRRSRESGAKSADDIRAVARAQGEVRRRVLGASFQNQRAEDLRRRLRGQRARGRESTPSTDAMDRAIDAMDNAARELDALRTSPALPHEMTALNELLRAQAEVRRREVQRQEAGGGGGGASNRQAQDLSSLFDRELARQQQTNYETPGSAETRQDEQQNADDALARIRELARRQQSLNQEHEKLAGAQGQSEDEIRRQLERLTREQNELRQQAEDLSRQLEQQARQSQNGERRQPQQQGTQSRQNGQGQQSQAEAGAGQSIRQAAEDMRSAASGLRRQDRGQASASGSRALDRLREVEQRMQGAAPDNRRRELGELQLEARQLADAQRSASAAAARQAGRGDGADRARRQAGEQQRLGARAERLERAIQDFSIQGGTREQRDALGEASRELQRQRVAERMRRAGTPAEGGEIARVLDGVADRLAAASGESEQARQLSARLARARELRERLGEVERQIDDLRQGEGEGQPGTGRSGAQPQGTGAGQGESGSSEWQQARQLLEELRREQSLGLSTRDLEGFNPGLSAPGTEPWKQDFARWDQLRAQAAAAIEKMEATAAARMREQAARDRLNAGRSEAVPSQYRELVDKYYRGLASGSGAAPGR